MRGGGWSGGVGVVHGWRVTRGGRKEEKGRWKADVDEGGGEGGG